MGVGRILIAIGGYLRCGLTTAPGARRERWRALQTRLRIAERRITEVTGCIGSREGGLIICLGFLLRGSHRD